MLKALITIKSKVKLVNHGITSLVNILALGLIAMLACTCISTIPTAA